VHPPARGPAPDWTEAFREPLQGAPGRVGRRNGRNHIQPPREAAVVSQLPMGEGPLASMGLVSEFDGSLVAEPSARMVLAGALPTCDRCHAGSETT